MVKKNDFVEIQYTGKVKDNGLVFDTTSKTIAKENGFDDQNLPEGPKIICVGQGQLIPGLDKDLVGKEENKDYTIEVSPEDGFGKKSAKNVQLVPTKKFYSQNINPVPGLQVNIDNSIGIIKTITGGRTMVDFNHPLASTDLVYEYKINRVVTDTKEKAESYVKNLLGIPAEVAFSEGKLTLNMNFELPDAIKSQIETKLKEVIPEINEISYEGSQDNSVKNKDSSDGENKGLDENN
ncbi:MAG: FKBP-type peptidyl-prolyl cis-trans isomerase [Nanobdellota archaeon]